MAREPRIRIVGPDGVEHIQTKRPEACVLQYANGWVTILVRRIHDVEPARVLADQRLAEVADLLRDKEHRGGRPVCAEPARVGWWTTVHQGVRRERLEGEALDAEGRIVSPCAYGATNAGAGVEFRAGRVL